MRITFDKREEEQTVSHLARPVDADQPDETVRPSSSLRIAILVTLVTLGLVLLLGLGVWQVERRTWKLDLIARVDSRIHAAPVAAPGPKDWPSVNNANDAYRHVEVKGHFLDTRETLVKAVTDLGPGYWVLAPFETERGFPVFVNRGFIPDDQKSDRGGRLPTGGDVSITGLLRITEPKGGFLRSNDPTADRWFSRDVSAMAAALGIKDAAPYFIDADAAVGVVTYPRGGLTVVNFPNNHLVYALTWFGLAAMLAGWAFHAARLEWTVRRNRAGATITQSGR